MSRMEKNDHDELWSQWRDHRIIQAAFQPIMSLRDGSILAYEGLSRPQLPGGQNVPVQDLINAAEKQGSLLLFDQIAFQCIVEAFCGSKVRDSSVLFINILPKSLLTPLPFLQILQQCQELKPFQIVLEISERETIPEGDHKLREYLTPFRDMGIRIALDDMGSGYSGLTRLIELQPDFAKIDLNLVRDVDKNPIKFALLESTARFAQQTAATSLIAEGIETHGELYTLKEIGIDFGQGYLLGKPAITFEFPLIPQELAQIRAPRPSVDYQLHTLLTTTQQLARGLAHGDGRYAYMLSLAKKLTGADEAALFRIDGDHLSYVESTARLTPHEQAFFRRTVFPQSPTLYRAFVTREPAIFQRPVQESRIWSDHFHLLSAIAVPICDHLGCWGLLHLGYHQADQIRPDLIPLVEGIAALFVLALGYTQKEEAFNDQALLGEPLFEAISTLADTANLEHLLAKTIAAALAVTGGHQGYIGILNETTLHCVLPDGQAFDICRRDLFDPTTDDGQGPVGQILQTRSLRIIPNILNEPSLNPWLEEMIAEGIQSAAGIPLISNDKLLGVLKVYHSQIGGFTPGRIRRLQALSHLATALIERSLNSLESNERARRYSLLAQSLVKVSYLHTSHHILELVVSTIQQYGPFPLVILVQPEGGLLVPAVVSAEGGGPAFVPFTLPRRDGHAVAQALDKGQAIYVNPESSRADFLNQFRKLSGFVSYAVIPVGLPEMAVIIFSRKDDDLKSAFSPIEVYTRAMGQALSKSHLQELMTEEQKHMDHMLAALKTLPAVDNTAQLWQRVGQILAEQVDAAGGWVVGHDRFPTPHAVFGMVPRRCDGILPLMYAESSPATLHETRIPLELREWGIRHVVGFALTYPELHQQGFFIVASRHAGGFTTSQMHRMEMLISAASSLYEILALRQQQHESAHTDPITRLPNNLGIEEYYTQMQELRHEEGAGCILIDIVGLGQVNRNLGEHVGTSRLTELAHFLDSAMNYEGCVGRYGHDDFILLYPDLNVQALKREIQYITSHAPIDVRWAALHIAHPREVPLQRVIRNLYHMLQEQGSGKLKSVSDR